jgi:hypothetical protein
MSWNGLAVADDVVAVASKNTDNGATPDARLAPTDSLMLPPATTAGVLGQTGMTLGATGAGGGVSVPPPGGAAVTLAVVSLVPATAAVEAALPPPPPHADISAAVKKQSAIDTGAGFNRSRVILISRWTTGRNRWRAGQPSCGAGSE